MKTVIIQIDIFQKMSCDHTFYIEKKKRSMATDLYHALFFTSYGCGNSKAPPLQLVCLVTLLPIISRPSFFCFNMYSLERERESYCRYTNIRPNAYSSQGWAKQSQGPRSPCQGLRYGTHMASCLDCPPALLFREIFFKKL